MQNDITYLGTIIRVDSNTVEVEVSNEIPSSSPIINGKVYKLGQIGSFVRIKAGNVNTYGLVEAVSNTPSNIKDAPELAQTGNRYLTISLVGEKIGGQPFEKGIGLYPTINDEVHLVTDDDLRDIYGVSVGDGKLAIGKHASSDDLDVYLDIHKLVLRHAAILGSTGSGKSNSVVAILKQIISQMHNSRMILIDPHGEYESAFPGAKVFKIGDGTRPLDVPFWLMNFDELAYFLVGAKSNDDSRPEYRNFREMITKAKKENCHLKAGEVNPDFITADSPIPFNIRKIWYQINRDLNATYSQMAGDKQTPETECLESEGEPDQLKPASFKPYAVGNVAPFKAKNHQEMYAYEKKLLARLKDTRYDFMFNPGEYKDENSSRDLHDLLFDWIGGREQLAILDLSNVPFEVMDITVGLITRFVYDSMFWGRNEDNTGRNRPLLIAYEEAHSYLGKSGTIYAKEAVERIFKEGRKFGMGAIVISQRPSELSDTILAQVGTMIALRLTNSSDQGIVKSMSPDNMSSLMNLLSSLRIGEAVIVGEAINIPSRVRLPLQNPRPDSSDPELVKAWNKEYDATLDDYKSVVIKIREQHF